MAEPKKEKPKKIQIKIDNDHFTVEVASITGAELRKLPEPDIGADRDLFLTKPGPEPDQLVESDQSVELKNGMHFFTAPTTINPGRDAASG